MAKKQDMIERLMRDSALSAQPIQRLPVIELTGENRVLIENHFGVCEYSRERISVKMKYGTAIICGEQLELCRMSKEQLVISGKIDTIALQRRI